MANTGASTAVLLQRRLDAERAGQLRGDFLLRNRLGQAIWLRSQGGTELQAYGPVLLAAFDPQQACLLGLLLSGDERAKLGEALWTPPPAWVEGQDAGA